LKLFNNKKRLEKIPQIFKCFSPLTIRELDNFLNKRERIVIINNIGRTFSFFKLLFFLRIKNYPQITISNLGNLHDDIFEKPKLSRNYFKNLLTKNIPDKIVWLLSILGIFKKIEAKFISNKIHFKHFDQKSEFRKKNFSYYKRNILVKSNFFNKFKNLNKKDISNKYIVLLDYYPYYPQTSDYIWPNPIKVKEHYYKLNILLDYLKKIYKKKIVICIHTNYPISFHKKRFLKYGVYKNKTEKFIKKAFLVLFFDSSAILNAIYLNKKILSIKSELFNVKGNLSDTYTRIINNEVIELKNNYKIDKKKFLEKLNSKTQKYKKYLYNYMSLNFKKDAAQIISGYIEKI
jgi:hypothetical protein